MEGVIDVHYASLTSQRVQHRVFCLDGHPSRYQPRPTGLNFGEQTGTCVFPLVIAVRSCALLFQSVIHSLFVGFYSILLLVTPKLMQELSKVGCVNNATLAFPIALSVH